MFVRPGGITTGGMDDTKNGIRADKVPRIDRRAALARIALQSLGINRLNSAIHAERCPTIQLRFVDVDSLIEFGPGSDWVAVGNAWTSSHTIARCLGGRVEGPVIGNVVKCSRAARRASAHQRC